MSKSKHADCVCGHRANLHDRSGGVPSGSCASTFCSCLWYDAVVDKSPPTTRIADQLGIELAASPYRGVEKPKPKTPEVAAQRRVTAAGEFVLVLVLIASELYGVSLYLRVVQLSLLAVLCLLRGAAERDK